MANMARVLGAVGMVAEGSVRDIPGIKKANMPVWGTGRVPGHGPFNLIETQTSVVVSKLKIDPGDLLIADEDGITRIPLEIAEETLEKCEAVRKKESEMMLEDNVIKRFELYWFYMLIKFIKAKIIFSLFMIILILAIFIDRTF